MAMTLETVQQLHADSTHVLMIGCAIILPIFTFWLMLKYLAPSFAGKLAALNNDSNAAKKSTIAVIQQRKSLSEKLSAITCTSKTESAVFESVWKITGRDKGFKLQFYPSLAYLVVFIFIFVFKSGQDVKTLWEKLPTTKMFLFFVYLPMFSISNSRVFISFHENFMASWIYQSTPIAKPGELINGALKALLTKFFVPVYLLLFAFAFYVWGFAITGDFLLGFFNNVLIILIMANLQNFYLPFSRQPNSKEQSGRFIQSMLQLIVIAALVGVHYLIILRVNWLSYCLVPVAIAGCYFLLKKIQNLTWLKISF
jgi:hypothetical protein